MEQAQQVSDSIAYVVTWINDLALESLDRIMSDEDPPEEATLVDEAITRVLGSANRLAESWRSRFVGGNPPQEPQIIAVFQEKIADVVESITALSDAFLALPPITHFANLTALDDDSGA